MRYLIVTAAALVLAACASQEPTPAPQAAAPAAKVPQCWSGDHGKFFNVGERANISGVDVVCEKTSDGKNGQWMGKKH
ncbi:MAG: hypothetical protein HYU78_12045 [Rhodocyclales bacterium]|nr:hypothetical protein [Rhodocyclales bacterium]